MHLHINACLLPASDLLPFEEFILEKFQLGDISLHAYRPMFYKCLSALPCID